MRAKRLTYSQVEFLCEQLAMILGSGMSVSEGLGLLCADSDDMCLSAHVMRSPPRSTGGSRSRRLCEAAGDSRNTRWIWSRWAR